MKVMALYALLDHTEQKKFTEFIASTYHVSQDKLRETGQFFTEQWPITEDDVDDFKAALYQKLFPGERYKDTRIRNLLSDLGKLIKEFLALEQIKEEPFIQQMYLLHAFREKESGSFYDKGINKLKRIQQQAKQKNVDFHRQQYELHEAEYIGSVLYQNRKSSAPLQSLSHELDCYFIAKKLRYACEMINRQNVFNETFDLGMLSDWEDIIQEEKYAHVPAIQVYGLIMKTLVYGEEEGNFHQLKTFLKDRSGLFTIEENKVLYGFAQNYCIRRINTGKPEFLSEIFDLYKLSLEQEVIFQGNYLSQWDYKNIVTVGLRLGEMDWTAQFIEDYQYKLPPEDQENAYTYNKAHLYFYQDKYEACMRLLQTIEFTEVFYALDSRSLLLKSYYLDKEYDALYALVRSSKHYLRRNKRISSYQKMAYINLFHFTGKLAKCRQMRTDIPRSLLSQIENAPQLADKGWLNQQLG